MVTLSLIKRLFVIYCSTCNQKRKANKKKKPPVAGRQIGLIISLNSINYYFIIISQNRFHLPIPPAKTLSVSESRK